MYNVKLRTEILVAFKDSGIEDFIVALNVADQYIADRIGGITVADEVTYELGYDVRSGYACGHFIYVMIRLTSDVISFSDNETELAIESDGFVEDVIVPEMRELFEGYEVDRILYKVTRPSDYRMS